MFVYNYDPTTNQYIGNRELDAGDQSPLEPGVYLIPAHCTTEKPPEWDDKYIPIFQNGTWAVVALPAINPPGVVVPTLEELKLSTKKQVEIERDVRACMDVLVDVGGTAFSFQADQRSQNLVMGTLLGTATGTAKLPPVWRTSNNLNVPICLDDLKHIGAAMSLQVNTVYTQSWDVKAKIDAATTIEGVQSIVFWE